jgi:hypothetical protein
MLRRRRHRPGGNRGAWRKRTATRGGSLRISDTSRARPYPRPRGPPPLPRGRRGVVQVSGRSPSGPGSNGAARVGARKEPPRFPRDDPVPSLRANPKLFSGRGFWAVTASEPRRLKPRAGTVVLEGSPPFRSVAVDSLPGCSSVWLERYVRDVEVVGSNPITPTISRTQIPSADAKATAGGICASWGRRASRTHVPSGTLGHRNIQDPKRRLGTILFPGSLPRGSVEFQWKEPRIEGSESWMCGMTERWRRFRCSHADAANGNLRSTHTESHRSRVLSRP